VAIAFKSLLKQWRGHRLHKEAASDLGVALSTYRKWEYGKRTPDKFKREQLERIMAIAPTDPKL
jgi:transcriptional regulator with XRE-family HTH domain